MTKEYKVLNPEFTPEQADGYVYVINYPHTNTVGYKWSSFYALQREDANCINPALKAFEYAVAIIKLKNKK